MSSPKKQDKPITIAATRDMSLENQERARQETYLMQRRRQGLAATVSPTTVMTGANQRETGLRTTVG